MNVKINLGLFREAHALCDEFERDQSQTDRRAASMLVRLWRSAALVYEGREENLSDAERVVAPLLSIVANRALWQCGVAARFHRLKGDLASEHTTIDRGIELANTCGSLAVSVLCFMEAAFSAWLHGDAARFERRLEELKRCRSAANDRTLGFFLACAYGDTPVKREVEPYVTRCYGDLMLCERFTRSFGEGDAVARAVDAVDSADLSGQIFLKCISRVVLATVDASRRPEMRRQVGEIVRDMVVGDVRTMLCDWVAEGTAVPGLIEEIERRFGRGRREVVVWLTTGNVTKGGQDVALTPRERELLVYLAASGRPVSQEVLVEVLFGDNRPAARNGLKVYVNRVRNALGKDSIQTCKYGYGLTSTVSTDIQAIDRHLCETPHSARALSALSDEISRVGKMHVERWPWYVALETRFLQAELRLNRYLYESARLQNVRDAELLYAERCVTAEAILSPESTSSEGVGAANLSLLTA